MEEREFATGTTARCNRCDRPSPLPKAVGAVRENDKAWRLQGFARLDCGHVDCHWVYERDLVQAEGKERMMEQGKSLEQKAADAAVPLADVQRAVFGPEPASTDYAAWGEIADQVIANPGPCMEPVPDMSNASMDGDRPTEENPDCAGCSLPCDEKGYCLLQEIRAAEARAWDPNP